MPRVARYRPSSIQPDMRHNRGMVETDGAARPQPTYVVLREVADGTWSLVGEVARRPGLPAPPSMISVRSRWVTRRAAPLRFRCECSGAGYLRLGTAVAASRRG